MKNGEHFAQKAIESDAVKGLPGPYGGVQVLYDKSRNILVIGPTQVPIVKAGTMFVPLPDDVKIYGRKRGKNPDDVFDLTDRKKLRWWVSALTIDPHHVLIDWDGESQLTGAQIDGLLKLPSAEEVQDVMKTKGEPSLQKSIMVSRQTQRAAARAAQKANKDLDPREAVDKHFHDIGMSQEEANKVAARVRKGLLS